MAEVNPNRPQEDFNFHTLVSKLDEKKMWAHPRFEQIAAKFWQMLRQSAVSDLKTNALTFPVYQAFMQRIYKVLLPVNREEEMDKEIAQEWVFDSRGQQALNLPLLQKLLFRIAHEWAVNFDIDEYLELLDILYSRIIEKVVVGENDQQQVWSKIHIPTLRLDFPKEEVVCKEKEERNIGKQDLAGWIICEDTEPVDDDFNYRYIEDKKEMVLRKYKKRKDQDRQTDMSEVVEPVFYRERAVWFEHEQVLESQTVFDRLTLLKNVVPLGYAAEQFLAFLKSDVAKKIEENRQHNKLEIKRVQREARERNAEVEQTQLEPYLYNKDLGMVEMKGLFSEQNFAINYFPNIPALARTSDILFCWFRQILRDGATLRLRFEQEHPAEGSRGKTRMLQGDDPHQFINTNCYNPALERRVHYRLITLPGQTHAQWLNVNYQLDTKENRTARRQDVQKVETAKILANKPDELKGREVDFQNDTPYREVKRIMLQAKFQDFADSRLEADEKEVLRMKKMVEHDQKRRQKALVEEPIAQKGICETFEEKSAIKLTRGPFHTIESLEGMREDNFISCEYQDIIDDANKEPLKLLVIGKPRSGKSTLCQLLAQEFDLLHVNVENWIAKLMAKIKDRLENPPDEPEEGEPPLPPWLTELEEIVREQLKWSEGPSSEQIEQILREQIQSPLARTKGFVLDLSFSKREKPWGDLMVEQEWVGKDGKFSFIIDLDLSDEEIHRRVEGMLTNPKFGSVYSQAQILERNKPKVLAEDEEEPEQEEEGDQDKGPVDLATLVTRPNDTLEAITAELDHYAKHEKKPLEKLTAGLLSSQIIRVDAAGRKPECIQASVSIKMRQDEGVPLRPIAIRLEEGGFKDLLTAEQPENSVPRRWSLWKQTDPVALLKGKVLQGVQEFAASYSNNVFCFANEANLKEFLTEPKKFLQKAPKMPKEFRMLMIGQKGIGKSTQAKMLSDLYGWPIYDYPEIVKRRLEEMNALEQHIPNNFVEGGRIGMNEQELVQINEGKPFPAWKFIPWLLDEMGYPLCKRKPPPVEEKPEEEQQEEELTPISKRKRDMELKKKQAELEKKKKEEDEKKAAKAERARLRAEALADGKDLAELGLEESEEEIIIDDLPIDDLVLKPNEDGTLPYVGGFILLGFPETEEQVNRIKAHGIDFDSVVYLQDTNEEEPGADIKKRVKGNYTYDFDEEAGIATKQLETAKQFINEEIVKEISANGTEAETFIRIRAEVDPFFLQVDNPENVRTTADLDEEQRKITRGNFAEYCPVTFVKDGWLVKGDKEQELIVRGKAHWFATEKELEEFKFNPEKFMIADAKKLPLQPPNPKIMIVGFKGAGVTTQIQNLCERFNLEEFQLQEEFLKKMKQERFQRQRKRLLERGFKPPQKTEEEEEDNGQPKPQLTHFESLIKGDGEIEEDPDDFEKAEHEKELMRKLIDASKALVIDGNWRLSNPDEVGTPIDELLRDSLRSPEIVIHLKCSEDNTAKRIIDEENIKVEFEKQMEKMLAEIAKERKEARIAREEELRDEIKDDEERDAQQKEAYIEAQLQEWDDARDLKEEETEKERVEAGDDPNLDKLREAEKEKLKETLQADADRLEALVAAFENKVEVHKLSTDMSPDYVFIKILNILKLHFERRKSYIERELAEALKPAEVKFYEQSYNFRQSKFGPHCPVNLANPIKTKQFAVLYRERIYFPGSEEDRGKFLAEPFKYASGETVPLDVKYAPRVFVQGLPKSGKSTVCKAFAGEAGLVHLQMKRVVEAFVQQDSAQAEKLRQRLRKEGALLDDETLVKLLVKRLSFKDCVEKGYVLEDFPRTRKQAVLLAEAGVTPSTVLALRITNEHCYRRSQDRAKFANNRIILSHKIDAWREQVPLVLAFYQRFYHAVREIDASRSKWYVQDAAFAFVQESLNAQQQFAKNYFLKDKGAVCQVQNFSFDRVLCKQSLSQFRYFCPVTWLNLKEIWKCPQNTKHAVLYKEQFYFFKSAEERKLFQDNPRRYLRAENFPKDIPVVLRNTKAAELHQGQKSIEGHCAVTLIDQQAVQKGDPLLIVKYASFPPFTLKNQESLLKFFQLPSKYSRAKLPTKMPPKKDAVSLFELQKDDETMITYMEESVGKVVTQGLREVSENRLKYPGLSVKETMLKLFALFLKTMNPANTEFMKTKYQKKMQLFIERCEMPEELYDLAEEREKKRKKGKWPAFKEEHFNELGAKFDNLTNKVIPQEKLDNFASFIR